MSMQIDEEAAERSRLVLVGFGGAMAAAECIWSLLGAGFRVAVFHRQGLRPAVRHIKGARLFPIRSPEAGSQEAVTDLRALVRQIQPNAVLGLDDQALWLCNEMAKEEEVPVAGPDVEARRVALNKNAQIALARNCGLQVPSTQVVEDVSDATVAMWPTILRPSSAVYESNGVLHRPSAIICANSDELESVRPRWQGPTLVQSYIRGVGEGLFGHASRDGVVAWSAHRRIRMVNPQGSGSSACESLGVNGELVPAAERFVRRLRWRGMFMLEFLRDHNGQAWFMELNGRAWGSMTLARSRGFEYPAWTVLDYLNSEYLPKYSVRAKHRRARHLGKEVAHLGFVLRGAPSSDLEGWPRPWRTLSGILRFRRGDVVYNWNRAEPLVLYADTVSTLRAYGKRFLKRSQ